MILQTIISTTGGGGGVSIDVITASSLPATVVENQIVVITSTTPNTIYVDTNEPANPVSGDVWVQVGSSDYGVEISEAFRNGLIAAKQYDNGEWTFVASYVGLQSAWRIFSYELPANGTPLENYSLEQIDFINKQNLMSTYFEVGDTKTITINGVAYNSQIADFAHDTCANGSVANVTFLLQTCLNGTYIIDSSDTNADGWTDCELRETLQSNIFTQLPISLRNMIKPVIKKTSAGNKSSTIEETVDTLFLLSEVEAFGELTYSAVGEGRQYAIFTDSASRIKTVNGAASHWHLRSPSPQWDYVYCAVSPTGGAANARPTHSAGVCFAYCI